MKEGRKEGGRKEGSEGGEEERKLFPLKHSPTMFFKEELASVF